MPRTNASRAVPVVLLACSLLLAGCDDLTSEFNDDSAEAPVSEVIDLTRKLAPSQLRADGKTTDTLIARIPAGASTRLVTFTTTGGAFEVSGLKEVKIRAERPLSCECEKHLEARAVLRTDTIPGRVFVRATLLEYTDTVEVQFTPAS